MDQNVLVGCSGWNYRHWRGDFYPSDLRQADWFGFYATRFNAVEINHTFYRLPTRDVFSAWADAAPPGFAYVLKGSRFATHTKKLLDADATVPRFLAPAAALGGFGAGVLWQLAPSQRRDDARLGDFLAQLPVNGTHAIEFRHPSWFDDAVFASLDRAGVGFVVHDIHGLAVPAVVTGGLAYLRLHGWPEGRYAGSYPDGELDRHADWLRRARRHGAKVRAFFNNDIGGDAPRDAERLAGRLHPAVMRVE